MGIMYRVKRDFIKSEKYLKQALETRKILFTGDRPDLASTYQNLGSVYIEVGNSETGLEYLNKALKINGNLY